MKNGMPYGRPPKRWEYNMDNLNHVKTLHQLLGIAYKDMLALKKDSRYRFNVSTWHQQLSPHTKCSACIAGSIMAGTLKVGLTSNRNTNPSDFDDRTHNLLDAVNSLRMGATGPASNELAAAGIPVSSLRLQLLMRDLNSSKLEAGDNKTWHALWKDAEKEEV